MCYVLRKVFIGKEVIISSSKNLIVLMSIKKLLFLITRIYFTYQLIILNIEKKQNDFFKFF